MRITLTIADAAGDGVFDVVLDADPASTVGEIAGQIIALTRRRTGNLVRLDQHRRADALDLFLAGRRLDPAATLEQAGLLEGCLVTVGEPVGAVFGEPSGVAEIRIVAGQGAGAVHVLAPGEALIGSDRSCDIVVPDSAVPAVALSLSIRPDGAVTVRISGDVPDSVALELDGQPLPGSATAWPLDGELTLGQSILELRRTCVPDAALDPSRDGIHLDYNRPPRLLPPTGATVLRLPKPPASPGRSGLPLVGALAPAALGSVMAVVMRNPIYLVMAFMTPAMLLGNAVSARRQGKKSHRAALREHRQLVAAIEADATAALVAERRARRDANPDPAEVLMTAVGPRSRLWERRRTDPDHLSVRVGTGDLPSDVVVEDPDMLEHRRLVQRVAHNVPVAISLREAGVLGVAGRADEPQRLGTWLVAQLAVLQSPRDVQICLLTDRHSAGDWTPVAWLPHARPSGQDTFALVGTDAETLGRRVAELSQIVAARSKAMASHGSRLQFEDPDIVVVVDGARRLRALPGLPSVLRDGPAVGVYSICLDADERLLPEECTAVVSGHGSELRVRQQRSEPVGGVRPDLVPAGWFARVARALAPIRDTSGDEDGGGLPGSARLLDLLALEPPTPDAVAARWAHGGSTTEAIVGASIDGPFAIDLRRDGPHGLVAGTTGAGKSELLQTIVASLAVANRPDAMTFVLIDYKGGAAFKDCVKLPHTVGMVTDLDTHLVERALTSLSAELTRREHILAGAAAKDIEDYVDAMSRDRTLAPLPRLLIVIDEFASMVRELPDFVTGLVNIAQRGRSLGIHLILATQRPSGVVSPEIRANTNLRIALRVTDPAESSDVIDVPDAARIPKSAPGRALVRLGHASLVPFQSGRIGGRRPGAVAQMPIRRPFVAALRWDDIGRPVPQPPTNQQSPDSDVTDLAVLVDAIGSATERLGLPPQHSPWLPALPELVDVADLPAPPAPVGLIPTVPCALEDLPAEQAQRAAVIDFATFGHQFIVGAPRSGRSQALRTIAASVARRTRTSDVHLFAIDCGNGALLPLARLPHCGAVVQRTQTERATRLITRLKAEVLRRQELLGQRGFADITEQRAATDADGRLPHLLVLLDRWEGFTPTLGEIDGGALTEALWMIMREGASVGVHLIITGDRSLLTGRVSTLTEDKIVLRLTDRGDYSLAGLNPRKLPEEPAQGRGFRADSGRELQFAVLGGDATGARQAEAITAIAEQATLRDADVPLHQRPFRVDVLPSRLTFAEAWERRPDRGEHPLWALVGVGGDGMIAIGPDLGAAAATFVVAGPPQSGRSSVLLSMARSVLAGGAEVVITAPRTSPLRHLEGTKGVRAVITDDDLSEEVLRASTAGEGPVVLVMDDAELHKDVSAKEWLRAFARTARDQRRALVIAGNAAEVCQGFSGWQIDVRKNRQGALLSPQNLTDGDIVGLRVPRSAVGGQVVPGRALVHLGDGEFVTVQVPIDSPAEVGRPAVSRGL